MGLTLDNIVQQKTGTFSGSSGNATLDVGTTAGNAVLIIAGMVSDTVTASNINSISGFTVIKSLGSFSRYAELGAFIKTSASADETSWTLTITGDPTLQTLWAAFEISGADLDWTTVPYRNNALVSGTVAELSSPSGTTSTSETFDGLAIAAFMATSTDTTVPTFTAYTNNFFEIATDSAATSPKAGRLAVVAKQQLVVEGVSCTATHAANAYHGGLILVFTGLDSHHATTPMAIFGAEVGTPTGLANIGAIGPGVFDAVAGFPDVVTANARTGSYCIKYTATSAACNTTWIRRDTPLGTLGVASVNIPMWTERVHVFFETSLPSTNVELFSAEVTSLANGVVVRYVNADQKIGVKIGSGTELLSDAVVTANTWIGIDLEYDPRTTTHAMRWAVDYDATVDDTTPEVLQTTVTQSGMTAGGITTIRHGWTTSTTATVYMDDIVATKFRLTFPIGDVRVFPRKVDPAGTPAVILADRSAAPNADNFKVFTNNGSMATWTAAGCRNALDDIPPAVGATADGLAQVTVPGGAVEYVTVPIETFTFAPDYVPLGARCYWAGWASSGNPAQMVYHIYDGTGSFGYEGRTVADSGFDDTTLRWTTGIVNPSGSSGVNPSAAYHLTQAKMDALAIDFGESADVNPDCGVLAVLFEIAVQPVVVLIGAEAEDGIFRVYVKQDRKSGTQKGYLVTTPVGRGATVFGTISGSDWSQHVDPNTALPITVQAETIDDVTAGPGLTPDQ